MYNSARKEDSRHGKHGRGSPTGNHNTSSNATTSLTHAASTPRHDQRPNTAEREAGVGVDTAIPEEVWRETMEHLTIAEHVFSRMLEITAQPGPTPGPEGTGGSQSFGSHAGGNMGGGTFIGSTFDGYAASFNAKNGYVDFSLRDARNLPNDAWSDQNAEGGFIQNNIRVVSKRNLRALENLQMKEPESVYAAALGGTAAGLTAHNTGFTATYNDDMDSQHSGDSSVDLIDKTRPTTPGATTDAHGVDSAFQGRHIEDYSKQTHIDGELLTRHGVKTESVNLSTEHNRQVQQTLRQQRLLERMKAGSGPGQESALDKAARVKAQEDSAVRLCVFRHPPTLPEGSTLRDLPLEKTEAFLTKMPKLT